MINFLRFSGIRPLKFRLILHTLFLSAFALPALTAQEILCPADLPVVSCNAALTVDLTGEPALVDLCPNPVVQYTDLVVSGDCPNAFTTLRTWTVTDDCMNSLSCVQTIQAADLTPPVFADAVIPPTPIAVSLLGRTSVLTHINLAGTGANVASVAPGAAVTLTLDRATTFDPGGLCPSCITQHYIGIKDVFSECLFSYAGALPNSGTHNINFTAPADPGVYYITMTGTFWYFCYEFGEPDLPAGPADAIAVLTVGQPGCPPPITVACTGETPNPAVTGTPVVSEPCNPALSLVFSDVIELNPANCPALGQITRTWTATDACGNTNVCTQIITLEDNAPPLIACPPNATVECGLPTDTLALGVATAVDDCSAILELSYSDGPTAGTWPDLFERSWTAVDACGNAASCVQTVTLEDSQAPLLTQAAAPLVIACDDQAVVDYWLSVNGSSVANDACSPVAWSNDFSGVSCGDSATVTFTVTDAAGNTATTTAVVYTVPDETIRETGPAGLNYKENCQCLPEAESGEPGDESAPLLSAKSHPGMEHLPGVPVGGTFSILTGRTTPHIPFPDVNLYAAGPTGRTTGHIGDLVLSSKTPVGAGRTTGHVITLSIVPPGPIPGLSRPAKMVKPEIAGPPPCACSVNSHTGNLFVEIPLLEIPAQGPNLNFTLAYNNGKTALRHGFGNGWTFNYNLLWERQGTDILIRRGDGRRDVFIFENGAYTAPPGISDTLVEVAAGQFVLTNKYGTQYYFNDPAHRRLTKITGRNTRELSIAYQDSLPVLLTDSYGRAIRLDYQDGLLRTVTDLSADAARTVRLEYDGDQNLQRITDPLGYSRSYRYDIRRNIIQATDPNGNITDLEYTDQNAVSSLRSAISAMTIEYDTANRQTVFSQLVGDSTQVTTYTFDGLDRVAGIQGNCCGYDVLYAYDDRNNITKITDAAGNEYQYTYDARGNVLSETAPLGYVQSFAYDPQFSQLTSWKDRSGNQTAMELDARGNITTLRQPLGATHYFSYTQEGLLSAYTDPNGHTTTHTYDDFGYRSSVQRLNVTVSYHYDPAGHLLRTVSPEGDTTYLEYDARNRLTRRTDPLGYSETFQYDGNGNLLYEIGKRGFATRYQYDAHNRMTRMAAPLDATTEYAYDARGNRNYRKDPNGNETYWTYNRKNQLIAETDALGNTQHWEYDLNGNRIRKTDRQGRTTGHTYDLLNRRTATTNALNETTTFSYDANGNNTSITSPTGVSAHFEYDSLDRLARAQLPFRATRLNYDPLGQVISLENGNGQATTLSYDALDRLVTTTDALGRATAYSYDLNGNIIAQTDPRGGVTRYAYDPLNRLIRQISALGDTMALTYDAAGNPTSETNERGFTRRLEYDALDRLIRVQWPIGAETYAYDKNGNRVSSIDRNGRTTGHTYDALDRKTRDVFPDGATMQYTYDAVNNMIASTNESGETTSYTYDALDRPATITNPENETTAYAYDQQGNETVVTQPNGNTVRTVYDRQSRPLGQYDELGMLGSWKYDAEGNILEENDGQGNTTRFAYNAVNRVTGVTDAMGQTVVFEYDENDNIVKKTDRQGRTTGHTYDLLNRRSRETDALGNATEFNYDETGNLSAITDANGNTTSYTYDGNNRLTRETFADGATREYSYDPVGNHISRKDNNGATTGYTYDARDRLTARDYPGNNDDVFTYDPAGRLLTATNADASLSYSYDAAGRTVGETLNGYTTQYAYDIPNRTRTKTYPGGTVVLEETDPRNRLASVQNDGADIASWTYDMANRIRCRWYGNNTIAVPVHNPNNWILELTHEAPADLANKPQTPDVFGDDYIPFLHYQYTYDLEGNKLGEQKRHAPERSDTYAYDAIYRLTQLQRGVPGSGTYTLEQSFGYDPLGNRSQATQNGQTTTYTANAMNEYTAVSGQANPVYDANGNLVDNGTHTFQYDYENRLIAVDNGATAEYAYDPLGRRIRKSAADAAENYLYDGARVIEERRDNGDLLATYTYGIQIDDILYSRRFGQEYYYHQNALGSVTAITDAAATVVELYEYDAYGKPEFLNSAGSPLPFSVIENPCLFTGRRWDMETQLYYYRSRHFDPRHGRFIQRDKTGYADGLNLYEYVRGNPVNYTDPYGWARISVKADIYDDDSWFYGADDYVGNFDFNIVVENKNCVLESRLGDPAANSNVAGLKPVYEITKTNAGEAACCCPEEVQSTCNRFAVLLKVVGEPIKQKEETTTGVTGNASIKGIGISGNWEHKSTTEYSKNAAVYSHRITFEACPAKDCKTVELRNVKIGNPPKPVDMDMGDNDIFIYKESIRVEIEN